MRALLQPWSVGGWIHHPAVKMWKGYEPALLSYQRAMCREWTARGFADTCMAKTLDVFLAERSRADIPKIEKPWWYGRPEFHRAHQSNLVRKDEIYAEEWPSIPGNLPYLWPSIGRPDDLAQVVLELVPGKEPE